MFKKVIGQDQHSEPVRSAPQLPDTRQQESPAHSPQAAHGLHPVRSSPVATRNVLSSDVEIKGTVKFTNDLVVDGRIEGEITSDGNLTVGENARIKAEIKTATVIVYGKVHGNLTVSDRIELKASAEVVGDIKTKTLSIEAGAIFVGRSTVGTPAQLPVVVQQPAAQAAQPSAQAAQPVAAKPAVTTPAAPSSLPKQGTLLTGTNP